MVGIPRWVLPGAFTSLFFFPVYRTLVRSFVHALGPMGRPIPTCGKSARTGRSTPERTEPFCKDQPERFELLKRLVDLQLQQLDDFALFLARRFRRLRFASLRLPSRSRAGGVGGCLFLRPGKTSLPGRGSQPSGSLAFWFFSV